MIKGIVFDKDGTLLDYESFWVPVAEGAVKLLLGKHCMAEKLSDMLDAIGAYDGISGVLCHGTYGNIADAMNDRLGLAVFDGDEVGKAFADSVHLSRVRPSCENIREVFEALRAGGITTAIVTSDNEDLTRYCICELGISDLFDNIYTDDGIHPSKPEPYYMECFCSEHGFEPSEVLMVGDTMTDIKFAKNSKTVSVGVGKYAPELLSDAADHIIPDISCIFEIIERY